MLETGGDDVTPDMLVYTLDHIHLRGQGNANLRNYRKGDAPNAFRPTASVRRAAAVHVKRPPLAERKYPKTLTILL